jgi:hypothetical protein
MFSNANTHKKKKEKNQSPNSAKKDTNAILWSNKNNTTTQSLIK